MKIVAHDEDSMTNLFFSEVYRHKKMEAFLDMIEWRDNAILPFKVKDTELHQQVNFSDFGKPDAVIIITDNNGQKHIVIVEVKLGKYLENCISNDKGKINNKSKGDNSRLNNQLTLRYRAMKSLSSIAKKDFIMEVPHSQVSPYSNDIVRRCKKPSTINLFRPFAQEFEFYLVILTSDNESPLNNNKLYPSDPCFPLFFDQHSGKSEFCNLGSVRWLKCKQLFDGINDNYISDSFHALFQPNPENEKSSEVDSQDLFVRGRKIIKFNNMSCHLSCKNYSYVIRHIRKGSFVEIDSGKNDKEKYLALKSQIKILESAPSQPIDDVKFWEEYFSSRD
jgi:hypothetical protein